MALFMTPLYLSSDVEIVKVKAQGLGADTNQAIDKAIVQALSMVNGKSIESETLLKSTSISGSATGNAGGVAKAGVSSASSFLGITFPLTKSASANANSDASGNFSTNTKEMQDTIKSKTNGIIDGYKIISQSKTERGNVKVLLEVRVAKFKIPKSANRKKIAVINFIPRDSCCSIKNNQLAGTAISSQLTDALNNYLVQTRKFTILDRSYQETVKGEKQMLKQGNTPITDLVKLGQELISDYLLVGTLNSLRVNEKEIKLKTTDKVFKRSVGSLNLNYRLIDVATGQVKFSQNLNTNLSGEINLSQEIDQIIQDSIQISAKEAGYKILEAIYPFVVESIDDKKLTIGTGGDMIEVGQKFKLIKYGDKIIDSYTKESLGRKEIQVGVIEITEVTSKMSYAKVINLSQKNALEEFKPKSMIIRSLPMKKNNNTKKKQKEMREKLDKEFDDGW